MPGDLEDTQGRRIRARSDEHSESLVLSGPEDGFIGRRIDERSMKNTFLVSAILVVLAATLLIISYRSGEDGVSSTLTVAEGFTVERVAGPPLVDRPITADFDDLGRLYVADSSGSNDKVERQLEEKPHRIVRLEDSDGDGRFDRSTVFADRMMFPEGTLWYDGSLYVAAPPHIWKLTDTDDDGVADRREEWFDGKTLTGCANDLHGPYLGNDGWIYWCKGAFAEQTYPRPGKAPLVTRAAHIFRRRPQGGPVEAVMTGGMDNPVDVDFTPEGERILSATFLEHPQLGRRDALVHAIYGGVYGKEHEVLRGHKRTGALLPELTHLGPAAPCGLTRYRSRVFGDEFENNFFACLFNMRKVTRHVLVAKGSSFRSQDSDFLVSTSPDFHPTDVLEDADGSLIVIDTGGWYKLCCPTSQLAKPDVLGAIYRIRKKGPHDTPEMRDPRGLQIDWSTMQPEGLAGRLDDARPAVRKRALHALAQAGDRAIPALENLLKGSPSTDSRLRAVWGLTRIEGEAARTAVRLALSDTDTSVRHAAVNSSGLLRDAESTSLLIRLLEEDTPPVQRASAEALGRIGAAPAVSALLAAASNPADRILEHSLVYALIEIDDPAATARGLEATSPGTRRAALVALDQMDQGALKPEMILPYLTSSDLSLEQTAFWIAGNHPEWGGSLARFFERRLTQQTDGSLDSSAREELVSRLASFSSNGEIQQLLARLAAADSSGQLRQSALGAMVASGVKMMPAPWSSALVRCLDSGDPVLTAATVETARALPPPDNPEALQAALLGVVRDRGQAPAVRIGARVALPVGPGEMDPELYALVLDGITIDRPPALRTIAASAIERAALGKDQLTSLCDLVARDVVGPMELPRVLMAFSNSREEKLGLALMSALERSRSRSALRAEVLDPALERFPEAVRERGRAILAALDRDPEQQARKLEELMATLQGGKGATSGGDRPSSTDRREPAPPVMPSATWAAGSARTSPGSAGSAPRGICWKRSFTRT